MRFDGTIAFLSGEGHVWPQFSACLAGLMTHHPKAMLLHLVGTNIAQGRNRALRDMRGDWLWFIDTDMVFAPDTLDRLLLKGVDLVQPLCLLRHPPHYPVLYGELPEEPGVLKQAVLRTIQPSMVQVPAIGTGGMLLRRRVRDALADPWFEVGKIKPDELSEDLIFCRKATAAGFKCWADLTTAIGHLTPAAIWPVYKDGRWQTSYKLTTGDPVQRSAAE